LLVNIDKFEPNPILVKINKLKTYRYLDKAPRGLEATLKGEESTKAYKDTFKMVLPKINLHQKVMLIEN
jgi:hypothetical protein